MNQLTMYLSVDWNCWMSHFEANVKLFCWRAAFIRRAVQLELIANDASTNRQKNLKYCSAILFKSSVENLSFRQRIQCSSGLAKLFSKIDKCKNKIRSIVINWDFILGWVFDERINFRSINIPAIFYNVDIKNAILYKKNWTRSSLITIYEESDDHY